MYEEGHYLALLNPEGSFYICQAKQDIPYKSTRKFKIQWLDETSADTYIKLNSQDTISTDSIIDEIILSKISKNKYVLNETEKTRIINLIQLCKGKIKGKKCKPKNELENIITPPRVNSTENHNPQPSGREDNITPTSVNSTENYNPQPSGREDNITPTSVNSTENHNPQPSGREDNITPPSVNSTENHNPQPSGREDNITPPSVNSTENHNPQPSGREDNITPASVNSTENHNPQPSGREDNITPPSENSTENHNPQPSGREDNITPPSVNSTENHNPQPSGREDNITPPSVNSTENHNPQPSGREDNITPASVNSTENHNPQPSGREDNITPPSENSTENHNPQPSGREDNITRTSVNSTDDHNPVPSDGENNITPPSVSSTDGPSPRTYESDYNITSDSSDSFMENVLKTKKKRKRIRIESSSSSDASGILAEVHQEACTFPTPNKSKKEKISYIKSDDGEITARVDSKEGTSRKYDQRHCCYFCHKVVHKISKHVQTVHKDEMEVAKIMAMPKKSQERREAFASLRRVGDYFHNMEVLATNNGELIVIRRPTEDEGLFVSAKDFGPCPNCLGFLLKKHIWHHIKHSCHKKKIGTDRNLTLAESNALLHRSDISTPHDFVTNIINKLKGNDEIPYICKNDTLILSFGVFQWEKYKVTNYELVRQTMRQLARLVIEFRKTSNLKKASLSDCLCPENFDLLLESVRKLCKETSNETERPTLENAPSLALKLGHHLRKCANLERGRALRAGDLSKDTALQGFLHLMSWEWSQKISSIALSTLNRRKFNTEELLPLTSDLMKLNCYMKTQISALSNNIKNEFDEDTWHKLKEVTLTRIMIFNKRRSGEAAKMRLKEYYSDVDWMDGNTQEIKKTFTPVEWHLSKTLKLVNVIGKRERKVAVIITPDCQKAISTLKEYRDQVQSVSKENKYLFPGKNNATHVRGDKVLRKLCENAKLEQPDRITSTRLRKYMATVIQIFDLSENESDWIARHLGHDIRVHRDYYRLQESAVELTKVSRLLMVVDEGKAADFKNKPLDKIELKDIPPVFEELSEGEEEPQPLTTNENDFPNDDDDDDDDFSKFMEQTTPQRPTCISQKRSLKTTKEKGWTKRPRLDAKIKTEILQAFRKNVKRGIVPNKEECCEFLRTHEHISKTWRNIKDCVHNHIVSVSKKTKVN